MSRSDADRQRSELLSSSFSFSHPTLLFPEARLYEDRLELSGWRLWGRYRRRIALHRILKADAAGTNGLLLWMVDGRTLRLRIDNPDRWERAITHQIEAD